ncbi:MAG: hypothetical protein WA364_25320 [Candidatus Nitrosopolaris sp.]
MINFKSNGKVNSAKMKFRCLTILFFGLVTVGALGNIFGIGYSIVLAQQQKEKPTITNDPSLSTVNPGNTRDHNAVTNSSQAFANTEILNLNHSFVSNKVVGPDRFRFITYYWTTPFTPLGVDVGTSTSLKITDSSNPTLAASPLPPNQKVEVDTNEGPSTLAVVLQYEGVVDLAGITAALKLPAGFKAQLPLIDDRTNFDIALSSYRGHIYPSQGIVLYFPVNVLPTAKVNVPYLGPLALHFLRSNQRSTLNSLDASQQNLLARALSFMHTGNGTSPKSTILNGKFDLRKDYFDQLGRFIPYDFVNQVIPVVFNITGQETIDVVTLKPGAKLGATANESDISTNIVEVPYGVTSNVSIAVRNTGDLAIHDCGLTVSPRLESALGINGLNPSAITSPNVPQTLFSTLVPMGIVGASGGGEIYCASAGVDNGAGILLPHSLSNVMTVSVFPTKYVAGTVDLINCSLSWRDPVQNVDFKTQNSQVFVRVVPPH